MLRLRGLRALAAPSRRLLCALAAPPPIDESCFGVLVEYQDKLPPWVIAGADSGLAAPASDGWPAMDTQFLQSNPHVRLAHFIARDARGDGDCAAAAESRPMHGRLWFGRNAAGPPGHAHGGAQAAVLDEAMGGVCWYNGYSVLAGEITVRFLKPLPLGFDTFVFAQIDGVAGRKLRVSADIATTNRADGERVVFARAHGTFIKIDLASWQPPGATAS